MKIYIYRKKVTTPVVLTTQDKNINEIKNIISDAILKNKTLMIENENEIMYVKSNDIDVIKVSDDIELTNDSFVNTKVEDLALTLDIQEDSKLSKEKKNKKKNSTLEVSTINLVNEENLEKKDSNDYSININ